MPAAIGTPYDLDAEDIVGSRDSMRPDRGRAVLAILDCRRNDWQVDAALAATCVLYPPLVCKITPDALGGVVIPVIQN